MQRKPYIIRGIALVYLLSPVFFLLQYFYFSKAGFGDVATWKSLWTPYKLSFLVVPPVVAFGIYRIRMWGWYLSLAHMVFLLGNNTMAFLIGSRTPPWAVLIFTLGTLAVLLTFVKETVRAPYFNPRIRWWEAKPRYAITLQADLQNEKKSFSCETYNVSEGGMFVVSPEEIWIDDHFEVKLSRSGGLGVSCKGRVVWVNPEGQPLPKGFGVQFIDLSREALTEIHNYIKDQKRAMKAGARSR